MGWVGAWRISLSPSALDAVTNTFDPGGSSWDWAAIGEAKRTRMIRNLILLTSYLRAEPEMLLSC